MEISQIEFELLRELVYQNCGIVIKDDKKYLITQRLTPLALELDCSNFGDFYRKLMDMETHPIYRVKVIEAITTNETSFFRDSHPFETFEKHILEKLIASFRKMRRKESNPNHKIRIWSAASSTGQEPYSIAIIIKEFLENPNYADITVHDFKILATDISSQVLSRAMSGIYNQLEISRGLARGHRNKYFRQEGNFWVIDDRIRQMVEFRQVNLIKPFTGIGCFEFIVCRNVLIYFDDKHKTSILDQFSRILTPGGFMLLGAMENTLYLTSKFESERIGKTVYYKKK